MSVEILFAVSSAAALGGKAFSKLCSNIVTQNSAAKYSLVLIVNSLVACAFFLIFGGFRIAVNVATLWYSFIYAAVVAVSVIMNLVVYRYATISNVSVITSASSMICTAIMGWWIFSEQFALTDVIRLALMLAATVFVLMDKTNSAADKGAGGKRRGGMLLLVFIILAITAVGCANTVVLKFFTVSDSVTDENSFFFFTNVLLCLGAFAVFLIVCLRKKSEFRDSMALLYPKRLVSIAGNTVCSNISSVVGVMIIAQMDVSLYSPISAALGIIVGLIGSLIFREKLGVFSYVAAAIACVAVIL